MPREQLPENWDNDFQIYANTLLHRFLAKIDNWYYDSRGTVKAGFFFKHPRSNNVSHPYFDQRYFATLVSPREDVEITLIFRPTRVPINGKIEGEIEFDDKVFSTSRPDWEENLLKKVIEKIFA